VRTILSQAEAAVVVDAGEAQTIAVSVPIPAGIARTVESRLITCSHEIIVEVVTAGVQHQISRKFPRAILHVIISSSLSDRRFGSSLMWLLSQWFFTK
jgi:hypothetical protein